jgi:hypothetical protein
MHTGALIGTPMGCAARTGEGIIPGQFGNWAYERAYWCPGLAVEPIHTDITSMVTIGAPNTVSYVAGLGANTALGSMSGDTMIDLSTYVVYYQ